ncbi:MAG: ABC transporter permease [Myxococcales bacterium]|nr:ABC transporter permease [Myxococcales bacterium]
MNFTRIGAIAANTVREALRHKVLYVLLAFGLVLICSGALLSSLSYVERERILQDIGLGSLRLFGAAIAIFVGVGLIHREVDRRTIFTILSKPVARTEFLLGKFAGLTATLWMQAAIMAATFGVVSLFLGAPLGWGHLAAVLLAALEFSVLVAVATLFSSFTTPLLASLFTAGFYLVGHLTRDLRELGIATKSEQAQRITDTLYMVVPDLERFNVSTEAVHGLPISAEQVGLAFLLACLYCTITLGLASLAFERRDFR